MLDRCSQIVQSLLFGCLFCLVVTTVVNADGRVFVLDLRNSSGLQGFRDAEQVCASRHTRLASAEELRHAVEECFFSSCTRGWLHGGTVGTTVCNTEGSSLKAVDVRTENATEDTAHLDAFCIKDKGEPCGDPPSFPNARLQGHSGFEMGDELLYACVPGYVMPNGQSAFSLLCDSCGEWYGLVQICVQDESEVHIDYEDTFTDSHGEAERHEEKPEGTHGHMYEEVDDTAYRKGKMIQEQQETGFSIVVEKEHQGQHGEQEGRGEVMKFGGGVEGREKDEERAVQDFIGHPAREQERREVVRTDTAAATEAPVSLLSQKHMFWFPSVAFQEGGLPVSTNPVTQTTQRASGAQSEESKEQESQERYQHPVGGDDHDLETVDHEDSHHDRDDHDSHHDEDEHKDHVTHYIPAQDDDLDTPDSHENHDDDHNDHYDRGEHEDDRYGKQEYDDRDDIRGKHESNENHEDLTDDRVDVDDDDDDDDDEELQHPHGSEEHPERDDHDDGEEHYDLDEDNNDYSDHEHDDHDSYDDHDSHESHNDGHQRVIVSIATDQRQNITQRRAGGRKSTTDETWLDGYPVVLEETEKDERGTAVKSADRPNEVENRGPASYTSSPQEPEFPTTEPEWGVEEVWAGFFPTAAPSPHHLEPSDSPSYSDTLDYDTQQAAPTHSSLGDLTEHPLLNHGPAPPVHNGDILTGVMEEHTMHNLPGETGERGEIEGERGETICAGDNCPPRPPSSYGQGPKVAAIIVAVFAVAAAVIVGVWCYRRQQQKSSVYEMNGKGQSQSRQGQQIEMQQKV